MTYAEYAALVRAQVGDRYILGAEASPANPDPSVFDCSELVEWSYARVGVTIPDGAWLQYNATVPVTVPEIGDLVFLRNNPDRPNGIGHVGIIVSRSGDIVEAKGAAYGVVTSTLAIWKQKSTYAGMRRYPAFTAAMQPGGSDSVKLLEPVPSGAVRVYRLFHPVHLHHYTTSIDEANTLLTKPEWVFENRAFDLAQTNSIPVYRILRANGKHLFTTSVAERDAQIAIPGAINEGIAFYAATDGEPVYRFPNGDGHLLTLSKAEGEAAGLKLEGVAFHVGIVAPHPSDANEQIATLEAKLDKTAELARQILAVAG